MPAQRFGERQAKIGDIIDQMKQSGATEGVKTLSAGKDGLVAEAYYKGVSSGTNLFDLVKTDNSGSDSKEYQYEFGARLSKLDFQSVKEKRPSI